MRALIRAEGGDDLRKLPLSMRKANHERLLTPEGHFHPFERGEIGPDLLRAACDMGSAFALPEGQDLAWAGAEILELRAQCGSGSRRRSTLMPRRRRPSTAALTS